MLVHAAAGIPMLAISIAELFWRGAPDFRALAFVKFQHNAFVEIFALFWNSIISVLLSAFITVACALLLRLASEN